jgi:membrane protein required for colicin V production
MVEAQLNVFDSVVIGVFAISCLVAFFRGFIREVLSLGAWVGAGMITIYFFPTSTEYMKHYIKDAKVAAGAGAIGTYVCALMGISIINSIIIRYVKTGTEVGMLDNLLGLTFGAARGAFIVSLGFLVLSLVIPSEDQYPAWLKEAKTREIAQYGASLLAKAAPEYVKGITRMKDNTQGFAEEEAKKKMLEESGQGSEIIPKEKGYKFDQRLQLDRLFERQTQQDNNITEEKPAP